MFTMYRLDSYLCRVGMSTYATRSDARATDRTSEDVNPDPTGNAQEYIHAQTKPSVYRRDKPARYQPEREWLQAGVPARWISSVLAGCGGD
jgi:hypothetical protein